MDDFRTPMPDMGHKVRFIAMDKDGVFSLTEFTPGHRKDGKFDANTHDIILDYVVYASQGYRVYVTSAPLAISKRPYTRDTHTIVYKLRKDGCFDAWSQGSWNNLFKYIESKDVLVELRLSEDESVPSEPPRSPLEGRRWDP